MPRLPLRRVLPPVIYVAVLAVTAGVIAVAHEPVDATSGRSAPSLSGTDLDGRPRDLADLRGRVVLVNFWASWCPPCEEEIPVLVRAQDRYAGSGLTVLGVNSRDQLDRARWAAEEWEADSYPSIHDQDGRIAVDWGVVGLPETFVVGRDGTIIDRHKGPVTTEWLDETVAPLVRP